MLLTLTAASLRASLAKGKSGKTKLDLFDLPRYTREELGLHGINLSTDLLIGLTRDALERFREQSDKAGCASLLLVESEPQNLGDPADAIGATLVERLIKVIQAGHLLGCSAVAVRIAAKDDPALFQKAAERLRKAVDRAEKLEMNVLISPHDGLTSTPERVTELLKKVGGFRVGTYPDFQTAAAAPDRVGYLRRLTPYASVVCASTVKFTAPKDSEATPVTHTPYELKPLVDAILSVGYDGTLAIDYRGTGDAKLGVIRSREALERLLTVQKPALLEEE
jgi:sugar phosphate isomerase/epimerase